MRCSKKNMGGLFQLWRARTTSNVPRAARSTAAPPNGFARLPNRGQRRRTGRGQGSPLAGAVILPGKVSGGQIHLHRNQKFDSRPEARTSKATDFGVNYLLNGSNGKISLAVHEVSTTRASPRADEREAGRARLAGAD